jgi:hypothetical protein
VNHSQLGIAANEPPRGPIRVDAAAGNWRGIKVSMPRTAVLHYGSRHWAIYLNDQLLAVTVYKKGALAIQKALASICSQQT